jgi:cytochrome c5
VGIIALGAILLSEMAGATEGKATSGQGGVNVTWLEGVRKLYHENCAVCHGHDGISLLPDTPNFANGERLDKKDADLLRSINEGAKDVMPPWKDALTPEQQRDLLSYVKGVVGDQVFQQKCNSCHTKTVPALPAQIPRNPEKIKNHAGTVTICSAPGLEKATTNAEAMELIKFLRALAR